MNRCRVRLSSFSLPHLFSTTGAVAQLGEHLLCKQGVVGSIPISSTRSPVTSSQDRTAGVAAADSESARIHGERKQKQEFAVSVDLRDPALLDN